MSDKPAGLPRISKKRWNVKHRFVRRFRRLEPICVSVRKHPDAPEKIWTIERYKRLADRIKDCGEQGEGALDWLMGNNAAPETVAQVRFMLSALEAHSDVVRAVAQRLWPRKLTHWPLFVSRFAPEPELAAQHREAMQMLEAFKEE